MNKYVTREDGAFIQSMSKQEVEELVSDVQNLGDVAISEIVETNRQKPKKVWLGTSAEYDALQTKDENTVYFVTGDVFQQINDKIAEIESSIDELKSEVEAELPSFVSQVETLVNDFRDSNCKDPYCSELNYQHIYLSVISSSSYRTFTLNYTIPTTWNGKSRYITQMIRLFNVSKYTDFTLTVSVRAESFVDASYTESYHVKIGSEDIREISTGVYEVVYKDHYITGPQSGTGNYTLDIYTTCKFEGNF